MRRAGMGGDIGETGETVPQKSEVGRRPCIRPPIFEEVVLLEACESTKRKKQDFLCEIDVFRQEKSDIYETM